MKHVLYLFLLLLSFPVFSQVCGVECSHVDHDFENYLAFRTNGNRESSNFTKYLPVSFHVFDGASNPEQVELAFSILQEQMVGTNIIPCRHQTNFYNEHDSLETEHPIYDNPLYYQAMQANDIAGTPATDVCNIYIFESVGNGVAGFSWINNNTSNITWDGIYLKADWVASSVITHEMGHYCGLYHTFNAGSCGQVEADCEAQGDFVCDTPPTYANLNCDNPYCDEADYTNHMDYTQEWCRDHFTPGQVERMHMLLVNGGRASVWQSGLCADPNLLDVSVLSINNELRCDEDYTPTVRLANYTNIDAQDVALSVVMNGQAWDTLVDVNAQTIAVVTAPAFQGEFFGEYTGEASIFLVGDNNPDNNVNTFAHEPLPHAVLNIDIQHDVWPESEQWKVYKEGSGGSNITGSLWYARGGNWGSVDSYDSFFDGMTYDPLFTHDEFCLTGGCYNGFFRHFGYATTQELYDPNNPDLQGLVCGVDFYVERGEETDTLYSYKITAFAEDGTWNFLEEDNDHEWNWGWHQGPSSGHVYDYCVEDLYLDPPVVGSPCLGDFNDDGDIDLEDLLAICGELGKVGECTCDMDFDADVDISDFSAFLQVYGTDCEGETLAPPTLKELEELGLRPVLVDMTGRRVRDMALGVYIAEVEVNGLKLYTKVLL